MNHQKYTLDNKIQLLHVYKNSPVSYCGIIINAGSRDELASEHGIAHFIEHTIFKGTKKRKSFHILSRMDDVGGSLEAFTTKEETWIYSVFLNKYYERFIELLSDIIFNPTFPEKEIEKEKSVILDEINSYKDSPSEQIYDDFEEIIFRNHPLGRQILGNEKILKKIRRNHLLEFIRNNYTTDQMIICSVGNISFEKIKRIVIKHFNAQPLKTKTRKRVAFKNFKPNQIIHKIDSYQAHCVIGTIAYDARHKNRLGLILLNNILGGPGMNSRLNLNIRERYGLAYNIESNYVRYSDTGHWSVYFGTDHKNLDKCIELTHKELDLLKNKKLGILQLHKAKQQLIGQLAISAESSANQLFALGKSFLLYNDIEPLEKVYKKIEDISAQSLLEIANEIFNKQNFTTLIFK
ncbi:MAG: pitrilysin family protein [Marinilabiliales bacterium]